MQITGEMVKRARRACGLNQTELADKLGVVRNSISRIESRATVQQEYIPRLDKIFGPGWRGVAENSDRAVVEAALNEAVQALLRVCLELLTRMERVEAQAGIKAKPKFTVSHVRSIQSSLSH